MTIMRTLWTTLLLLALVAGKPAQQGEGKAGEGEEEEEGVGAEGVEDQRTVGAVDPNLLAHGGEAAVHDAINEALLPDAPLEGVPLEGDPGAQAPPAQEDQLGQAQDPGALPPGEDESVPDAPPPPPPGPIDPEGLLHEGGGEEAHPAEPPTPVGSVDPEKLAHGDESVHGEGDKKDEVKEVPVGATNPEKLVHGEQQVHGEKPKVDQDGVPVGQADPEALVHGQGHVHQEEGAQEVPIGATDPETLVHGEAHAHEESEEGAGDSIPVGSVNPEHLAHGDVRHGEQGQEQQHGQDVHASKTAIGSVDPETLLHGDEGGHVHQNPKLTLDVEGRTGTGGVRVGAGGDGPGQDDDLVHRLMHGEEPHEHAPPADRLSAETLRQLKLDPELLKHMDLDKLFDTMQQDYQQWQQDEQQDSSKQNVMTFEITSENLMEELADKYHLKEKARLLDPQATDEWEADTRELERPAKGEDSVQHRLEMAANTEPLRLLHHRHKGYTLAHKHMHEDP